LCRAVWGALMVFEGYSLGVLVLRGSDSFRIQKQGII